MIGGLLGALRGWLEVREEGVIELDAELVTVPDETANGLVVFIPVGNDNGFVGVAVGLGDDGIGRVM